MTETSARQLTPKPEPPIAKAIPVHPYESSSSSKHASKVFIPAPPEYQNMMMNEQAYIRGKRVRFGLPKTTVSILQYLGNLRVRR